MCIPNSDAVHKLVAFPAFQFFHFSSTWTPTHLIKYGLQFLLTLLPLSYDTFEILLSLLVIAMKTNILSLLINSAQELRNLP